ncbi:hypothetical protein NMY22_g14049 [Coprinellus aureogranulatus]|nr:hypothetical protein NMY22_g14049 [Coprinellus aureogranulatus]
MLRTHHIPGSSAALEAGSPSMAICQTFLLEWRHMTILTYPPIACSSPRPADMARIPSIVTIAVIITVPPHVGLVAVAKSHRLPSPLPEFRDKPHSPRVGRSHG